MTSAKSKLDEIIYECETTNNWYEDHEFPASTCSLSRSKTLVKGNVNWLRVKEILEKRSEKVAEFWFVNKDSFISVSSGKYGSSELVGALATVCQQPEIFKLIFDLKQLSAKQFGVYSFKFWFNGTWQEVVVDDRLPTNENGGFVFISSEVQNNFLPSLMEKAYAKLLGSYEAISQTTLPEILHHLTGGIVESFDLAKCPPSTPFLTNSIFRVLETQSIIGCCINIWNKNTNAGVTLSNGLLTCHQYIINDIREIKLVAGWNEVPLTLVRLKNPWGDLKPWTGSWSTSSSEWKKLTKEDRGSMGLHLNSSAEFWMDFAEFLKLFDMIDLCNLTTTSSSSSSSSSSSPPISVAEETKSFKWKCHSFHGRWRSGSSAGGRPNCKDTHWTNPQFCFTLAEMDQDGSQSCLVIIELEQKDMIAKTHNERRNDIGFVVYKCPKGTAFPLEREFFENNTFIGSCDFYSNLRFVVKRFMLEPGMYVVLPSTYQSDVEGLFVLRVLSSTVTDIVKSPPENLPESLVRGPTLSVGSSHPQDPKEESLEGYFLDVASEDDHIGLQQMRTVLNRNLKLENQTKDFSLELCKHLVSLIDKNCKTRINIHEMLYLWNVVKSLKKGFSSFDKSNQGSIGAYDLKSVILSFGYKFSPAILNQLSHRYSNEQHSIDLESFLTCMVRILNLHEIFKSREKENKMVCTLEEWLELSLSTL